MCDVANQRSLAAYVLFPVSASIAAGHGNSVVPLAEMRTRVQGRLVQQCHSVGGCGKGISIGGIGGIRGRDDRHCGGSGRRNGDDSSDNPDMSLRIPLTLREKLAQANAFAGFFGWTISSLLDSARDAPPDYDDFRVAAVWGIFGLLFHGVVGTFYYSLLDDVVSGSSVVPVALKTVIDVFAFFPVLAKVHDAYYNHVQKSGPAAVRRSMRGRQFLSGSLLKQTMLWVPAQAISFAFFPTYWRVAWVNIVLAVSSLFNLIVVL